MRGALFLLSILSTLSVGAALNEGATDEEILSYARGVIDADLYRGTMLPIIDNWTFGVAVYLSSYDDLGDIGFAAWGGAKVADTVCSEYPGRFNRTSVGISSKDGDRCFGYIVLNRTEWWE